MLAAKPGNPIFRLEEQSFARTLPTYYLWKKFIPEMTQYGYDTNEIKAEENSEIGS